MRECGKFLVVEGPEGAGKTTVAKWLVDFFEDKGEDVVYAREPGGTEAGERARSIVLDASLDMHPRTELFLMLTARVEFVESLVKPALEAGKVVVADRFDLSTFAYQIHGRGLPEKASKAANELAKDGLVPDLTIVLLVSMEEGRRRQNDQGKSKDRIEGAGREFHARVLEGYKKYGASYPNSVVIGTDNLSLEQVKERAREEIETRFDI